MGAGDRFADRVRVLAGVTLVIGGAQLLKLLVPGRRLRSRLPRQSILAGLALAAIGFLLIPVAGLFIGFARRLDE